MLPIAVKCRGDIGSEASIGGKTLGTVPYRASRADNTYLVARALRAAEISGRKGAPNDTSLSSLAPYRPSGLYYDECNGSIPSLPGVTRQDIDFQPIDHRLGLARRVRQCLGSCGWKQF